MANDMLLGGHTIPQYSLQECKWYRCIRISLHEGMQEGQQERNSISTIAILPVGVMRTVDV